MSPSGRIEPEASEVNGLFRMLAIFTIVVSLTGFFLALWTGGLVVGMHDLLAAIGLGRRSDEAAPYPLGAWTLLIYVCGAVLGFLARRRPLQIGFALIPLGAIALLFGGPITRVYGIILMLTAAALIGFALHRRARFGKVGQ